MDWRVVEAAISSATGEPFTVRSAQRLGGGCINEAYCLADGGRRYFVKLNRAGLEDMFAAEAAGLAAIRDTSAILCPAPLCHGRDGAGHRSPFQGGGAGCEVRAVHGGEQDRAGRARRAGTGVAGVPQPVAVAVDLLRVEHRRTGVRAPRRSAV